METRVNLYFKHALTQNSGFVFGPRLSPAPGVVSINCNSTSVAADERVGGTGCLVDVAAQNGRPPIDFHID